MPSNKTPMGRAETTAAGNSGNASKSMKTSNGRAESIRQAKANGATRVPSKVEETKVAAPEAGPAQPKQTTTSTNNDAYTDTFGYTRDRYRYSDNPLMNPSRKLGEAEKQDDPASIRIETVGNGKSSDILQSAYTNFFLQAVSEADQEKYQIVETFSSYYAFFYGRRPPIYNYSGLLLNDPNHNWMNSFKFMYDNYFRGTASAELGAQAVVQYDKRMVSGFLLGMNIQQDAMTDKGVPFSFSLLVINHDFVSFDDNFNKFIEEQRSYLASLKEKATQEIAALNKDPNPVQNILKNSVLRGKLPNVSILKKDEKPEAKPETNKLIDSNTQATTQGSKAVTDIKNSTGDVLASIVK